MRRHLLLLSLLLLAAPLFGQRGRPGAQAGSDLLIRISSQTDRQVSEEHLRVQLLNGGGVPMSETFSASDGTATFRDVGSGNYKIRISGNSIETVTTDLFTVQPGEGEHTEYVHVAVRSAEKRVDESTPPSKQPIVSLSDLNAPVAAKSELDKGNEAVAKEDLKTASIRFQKAIEIYPQYARAYNNLGVVEMKQAHKDQAKTDFEKSISLDERFVPGYINLARVALNDQNSTEATAQLKKALAVDPTNVEGLALLARALYVGKNYDEALATARRVHLMPHERYPEVHLIAGNILIAQREPKEAAVEFEIYLKESPDSPRAPAVRQLLAKLQAQAQ